MALGICARVLRECRSMMILSLPVYVLRLALLSMVAVWLGVLWLMASDSLGRDPFGVMRDHASY